MFAWTNRSRLVMGVIGALCCLIGCAPQSVAETQSGCAGYPPTAASAYVLPFASEQSHPVIQGNCAPPEKPWTHHGNLRFAYDFGMPIGTDILAARAGTVVFTRDNFTDQDHGPNQGNALVILHEDGTYALYAHLTHGGARVKVGQVVRQGDRIALSGNSGESPTPHLHFQVNQCGDFTRCPSLPVTFRNASPNPGRLEQGKVYTALAW